MFQKANANGQYVKDRCPFVPLAMLPLLGEPTTHYMNNWCFDIDANLFQDKLKAYKFSLMGLVTLN